MWGISQIAVDHNLPCHTDSAPWIYLVSFIMRAINYTTCKYHVSSINCVTSFINQYQFDGRIISSQKFRFCKTTFIFKETVQHQMQGSVLFCVVMQGVVVFFTDILGQPIGPIFRVQ
jgi:hypothetical protein